MQDFPFDPLLSQIGKDLHGSGKRIALAGSQQVDRLPRSRQQFGQQRLEHTFRAAGAHVDQVQVGAAVVFVTGAFQDEIHIQAVQEFAGDGGDGRLIMQRGGKGMDGYHFLKYFPTTGRPASGRSFRTI